MITITKKFKKFLHYSVLILVFFNSPVFNLTAENGITTDDENITRLLDAVNLQKLHEDPTWLRLLHFRLTPKIAKQSDIVTLEFFTAYDESIHGQTAATISAKEELAATIRSFFQAQEKEGEAHPQCRYPARLYWLKSKLNLLQKSLPEVQCGGLEAWAKFQTLDSVSLVMVSGYFGNPASTFGHLLVKLNNSEFKTSSGNLLDQSINYGAEVPDGEAMPVYIVKGIFGGYVSRFADKKFYAQDLVYSKQELRDMWEYELDLSEEQKRLLVYHTWEMLGMQSKYYFLKENCGYRIAELLELVTGETLTPDYQPWYLPISVFQGLAEIENSRYIKTVTFLPSGQRKLYYAFDQLTDRESIKVNEVLANPDLLEGKSFDGFSSESQSRIIEFLLNYYQYRFTQEDIEKNNLKTYRNSLLIKRLKLPVQKNKSGFDVLPMVSPAKGAKPRLIRVGFASNDQSESVYEIGVSLLHSDTLSNSKGSLENSELSAFDFNLEIDAVQSLSIKKFDIISVQKLGLNNTKLYGEKNKSWRVSLGFEQTDLSCKDCTNFYLNGGLGQAFQLSESVISYGMLNTKYIAENRVFEITPDVGFVFKHNERFKSLLQMGLKVNVKNGQRDEYGKFETRYSFTTNNTLRASFEKFRGEEVKLSFYHHL